MGTDPKEKQISLLSLLETSPPKGIALLTLALVPGIVQGLLALHFLTMIIATFVYFGK